MADLLALQRIAETDFADIAHHWERSHVDGTIYRHDNMPHVRWASAATFPQHYHDGSADHVIESQLSVQPEAALREFLTLVRSRIGSEM